MSETPDAVARHGDLVVIHLCDRDWKNGEPLGDDESWLGQVTSVTRAGLVRLYQPAGTFAGERDWRGRPGRGQPLPSLRSGRAVIKSQQETGVRDALATAACRTWPGHEDHVRGYPALAEVRAALRPHLPGRPGWERLRAAAVVWEAARREVGPLLSAAVRARGEEFTLLSDRYDAAVTAANSACRELHEQAARTGSTAA